MTSPWSTSPAPCPSQVRLGLILDLGTPGARRTEEGLGHRIHGDEGNGLQGHSLCIH